MNNQELETKMKEILAVENFFDMVETAKAFEKDYKSSDFYKLTKIPLFEVIKESKIWYSLQLTDIGKKLQELINNLDLSSINNLISQLEETYTKENNDIMDIVKNFNNIVK